MVEHPAAGAPDAPRARRGLRRAVGVLGYVLAAVLAVLLWPTNLGGCTTLTIVSGHSMDPTYHTGDLVVARCAEPQVGDVVVYQPAELGGVRIIHRVVGGDSSGWQMRGDNNSWDDPFTPTDDEVLGVAKVHLPKVGLAASLLTSPLLWISLIVLALAILVWPARDRSEDEPEGGDEPTGDDADRAEVGATATADDVGVPHPRPEPVLRTEDVS